MRILVGLCLVTVLAGVAVADSKRDVEALGRKAIDGDDAAFAAGAEMVVKGARMKVGDAHQALIDLHGDFATSPPPHDIGVRPVKVEAVVDDARGIAWIHGRAKVVIKLGTTHDSEELVRVTGLAVKDKAWKVVAWSYSSSIDDKGLVDQAQNVSEKLAMPKTSVTTGDAALAKTAAGWLAGGFAAAASKTGKQVAIGTAEAEYKLGADAAKLAGSWAKLKLAPYKIEAKAYGKAGFVRAVVAMPVANKRPVPMVLSAIVVQEAGGWRWVALNWCAFSFPPTGYDIDTK